MKKTGIICMMAVLGAIGITSCGSADQTKKDDAIRAKIENKEALTPEDYTCIINYVGEYAEKVQDYVVNSPLDATQQQEFDKIKAEYPDVEVYRECIKNTPLDSYTPEQQQLIEKYAGYVEFAAPAGATLQTDPEAAGLEMETPQEDNGVIAAPQLEEKTVEKGF